MTTRRLDAAPLADHAGLSAHELIEVTLAALAGLAALHRAGYVHGDVRPQNLLVSRGPHGLSAFWVDLEHAVPFDDLAAGFSYISGWHAPHLERGQPQTPRADLAALRSLMAERMPDLCSADGGVAEHCLAQFVCELKAEDSASTLLDGEEARYRLQQLCGASAIQLPATEPQIGPPVFIANRAAQQWWRTSWPRWQRCGRPLLVRLAGAEGTGKTSFLRAAGALAALDGHRVVDLLPAADRDDRDAPLAPDWSLASELDLPGTGTVLVLLPHALLAEFLQQAERFGHPGTIVVVECRTIADSQITALPSWQAEECTFPPLSAREWYQWVNGSF
jgi:hypothetical protein